MPGLTDLSQMLATLEPELQPGEYVFASLAPGAKADLAALAPLGIFREPEGATFIVRREAAEKNGLRFDIPLRWILLKVHSDLAAVGLTAAFATRLAENNIPANIVAGRFHDHLFVPAADAERALAALQSLQAENLT